MNLQKKLGEIPWKEQITRQLGGRGAEICPYTAQTGLNSRLFCATRKFLTDLIQDNEKHPFCRGNPAQGVLFVDAGVKNTFMRIDEKGIRRRTR